MKTEEAKTERVLELEEGGARADGSEGTFPMTLATDGEASDGHILSIAGAVTPKRVELLTSHANDPTLLLGRVTDFEKVTSGSPQRLRAVGRVNLEDDGTWLAETRRGLFTLVQSGDLRRVSVRWDGIKSTRRSELPDGHPHKVKDGAPWPLSMGRYFEKWRVVEGSLVAIGADPKAMIGRAQEAKHDAAGVFFRALARSSEQRDESDGLARVSDAFSAVVTAAGGIRELGLEDADVINALLGVSDASMRDLVPVRYGEDGGVVYLPRAAWQEIVGESLDAYREALRLRAAQSRESSGGGQRGEDGEADHLERAEDLGEPEPLPEPEAEANPERDAGTSQDFLARVAAKLENGLAKRLGT